jgi:hypothetical protein
LASAIAKTTAMPVITGDCRTGLGAGRSTVVAAI